MARLLQKLLLGNKLGRIWPVLLVTVLVGGCILSPPIEPRDEPNLSPRIQPVIPDTKDPVIQVRRETFDGEVVLRAELFDSNREDELSYLFVSNERGEPFQSAAPQDTERGMVGDEYYFGEVDYTVNPCTGDVTIPGTEVITLFVSDRGFFSTSSDPRDIELVDGAIMVAYSWTLVYEAGICD